MAIIISFYSVRFPYRGLFMGCQILRGRKMYKALYMCIWFESTEIWSLLSEENITPCYIISVFFQHSEDVNFPGPLNYAFRSNQLRFDSYHQYKI